MSLDPPEIEWNEQLTFRMLTEITEDEDIKQGLFPVPGANPRNQGLPKTHWHWAVCEKLFSQHHDYQEKFALLQKIGTAKQKEAWHTKIKNRLKRMTDNTLKHIEVMGQTGAGIKTRSEIDTNQQNAFVTKWREIEGVCPYFFEMRKLIGQRPNNLPIGIGNNAIEVDGSAIIRPQSAGSDEDNISGGGYVSEPWDIEKDAEGSDNELDGTITLTELSKKRKPSANVDEQPEKIARTVATTSTKKKSKKDEFAEIARAEESTRQKEMEVAKVRAERDLVRSKVKLAKIELQREKLREQKERRQEQALMIQKQQATTQEHCHPSHATGGSVLGTAGHYREQHPVAPSFNFSFHDDLTSNLGGSFTSPAFTPLASRSSSESADLFSETPFEYTLPAAPQ
ncbi:hypothetical protein PAXINDRAFT_17820 [Paxillus involutus ATCC 200175]|uniref:Uncharacterized protein n=1 Tax=Paxillus involutus ATCC 200175 TaxID=664439 RepID=A0A0C9T0E6_PAXIN|nr:hypothetical protein PAXINDRAFT_17820 [Paxillus involutus ATCC 200175]